MYIYVFPIVPTIHLPTRNFVLVFRRRYVRNTKWKGNVTAAAVANRKCVQRPRTEYNLPHLLVTAAEDARGRRRESRTRSFSLVFCCANSRKWTAKKNREYNTRGKK